MKNKHAENNGSISPSERPPQTHGEDDNPPPSRERLERVEAALGLLMDHMQTTTKASEIIEAEHSRSLLSSIAFGFSAIALIAMWSVDLASEDVDVDLRRFTIGMSLLLLASVIDLLSASLLRKAVHRAVLEKDPSRLVIWQGPWNRLFHPSYWAKTKQESVDFYHHQIARYTALAIYIIAGAILIWAVFSL